MMYMYPRAGVDSVGGMSSSKDLVHWRKHSDPINPGEGDTGCFSGGGVVDDDGTAYIIYWMLTGPKGIGMARSTDRHFSRWTKFPENPVIDINEFRNHENERCGRQRLLLCVSRSNKHLEKGDHYYVACGNGVLVNKSEKGTRRKQFHKFTKETTFPCSTSTDLKHWTYVAQFLRPPTDNNLLSAHLVWISANFRPAARMIETMWCH